MNKNKLLKKINSSSLYKGLFKNSFWAFMGDSTAAVINLVVIVILIKLIGSSNLGLLVLTQTYMQIVDVILNVQSWKGVIQFGQKALVQKNTHRLLSYLKLGIKIDIITAIIGGVVAIFLAPKIGLLLSWNKETIMCAIILSFTIFSHLSGTSTAFLRISDKYHLVAIQKFASSTIKLISLGVVLLYYKKITLLTAAIIYSITDIIGNIILVFFAAKEYINKYSIRELLKSENPKDSKDFIKFTIWSTLSDITDVPVNYLDMFIMSLLGNKMVAIFKVFKQCVAILRKVTSAIQQAIMPQFSELVASKKKEKAFIIMKKIRNTILKIMIPLGLILGITSPIWLKIIFGNIYANYWYVLLIYLLIQIVALSYTALHPLYISLNKVKEDTIISLFSNIVYFITAYILVKIIGMLGIVFAFAIQSGIIIMIKYIDTQKTISEG